MSWKRPYDGVVTKGLGHREARSVVSPSQVRSAQGAHVDGLRVADVFAVTF
ncbi:Hypothetical protein A7982_04514 [Minicystis rosea]|nr:Hypothetical protein A7982_04514 [Minicystis rosea]